MGGHGERRKHEPRDNDRAPGDLTRRSCVGNLNLAFCARLFVDDFYSETPAKHLLSPSPTGTRKTAKPPLVCGLVATKRPNRVGERAGNAQEAEPRQNLKRGAGGARRRPTTEQRSRGCVPLGWGVLTHQAALNNSKTKKSGRRTCCMPVGVLYPHPHSVVLALAKKNSWRVAHGSACP